MNWVLLNIFSVIYRWSSRNDEYGDDTKAGVVYDLT